MRAQLSLEMLIVIVVVLGLVVILASAALKSANRAAGSIDQKTGEVLNSSSPGGTGAPGAYCTSDSECQSGTCGPSSRCL